MLNENKRNTRTSCMHKISSAFQLENHSHRDQKCCSFSLTRSSNSIPMKGGKKAVDDRETDTFTPNQHITFTIKMVIINESKTRNEQLPGLNVCVAHPTNTISNGYFIFITWAVITYYNVMPAKIQCAYTPTSSFI